jgi:hypothetical protein
MVKRLVDPEVKKPVILAPARVTLTFEDSFKSRRAIPSIPTWDGLQSVSKHG